MIASLIGLGITATGALMGAVSSARKGKQAEAILRDEQSRQRAWYNGQLSSNYINRTDTQNALTKSRDILNEQYRQARATNIVANGSDAQLAMQKASANKAIADATASIASNSSSYKDAIGQSMMANSQQYANTMANLRAQQGQALAQAGGTISKAGGELMASSDWGWLVKRKGDVPMKVE